MIDNSESQPREVATSSDGLVVWDPGAEGLAPELRAAVEKLGLLG